MSRSFAIDGLDLFDTLESRLSLSAMSGGLAVSQGRRRHPAPDPEPDPVRSRARTRRSSIRRLPPSGPVGPRLSPRRMTDRPRAGPACPLGGGAPG